VAIAQLPDMIRGFGPVKDANRIKAEEQRRALLPRLSDSPVRVAAE
jgi:indolepyruvate ferredoxin oxidoreductase